MDELFECTSCALEKEEKYFVSDIDAGQPKDEMTCEQCYDDMDNGLI